MSLIESLDQAIRSRRHECSEAVTKQFHPSVRTIFASTETGNPEFVGSCILLNVLNTDYVVTAAHIIDWTNTHAIYVGGTVGTEPVQVAGDIKATKSPEGLRTKDKFDFAFWKIPQDSADKLGEVAFLNSSRVSHNQLSTANRFYLAMGYPLARNKGNITYSTQSIKTSLSKYTSEVGENAALAKKLGVTGNEHFFLKFEKYSSTAEGKKVSSFKPRGMSGGALVDLGNFANVDKYSSDSKPTGYLCGLLIEHHREHQAMIAVRIEHVIGAISHAIRSAP